MIARVKALVRRSQSDRQIPSENIFKFGKYRINLETREAVSNDGEIVLSEKENAIMGLLVRADDSGFVIWQVPGPDRIMLPGDEIILAVQKNSEDHLRMINRKGLSIRKAGAFLQFAGLRPRVRGNGHVCVQSIKEGSPIESGNVCRLICQPG